VTQGQLCDSENKLLLSNHCHSLFGQTEEFEFRSVANNNVHIRVLLAYLANSRAIWVNKNRALSTTARSTMIWRVSLTSGFIKTERVHWILRERKAGHLRTLKVAGVIYPLT